MSGTRAGATNLTQQDIHRVHRHGLSWNFQRSPPPLRRAIELRSSIIAALFRKRTIMRTPSATLEPFVKSMKRRCAALKAASRVRSY